MSALSPNQIGNNLESKIVSMLGGHAIKQSGGGKFEKLDARDGAKFIYSAKATASKVSDAALRGIWTLWLEARKGARGVAGHGNNAKPAMVFELNGELLVLLRLADHVAMVTEEIPPYVPQSKAQARRAKALSNPREQ